MGTKIIGAFVAVFVLYSLGIAVSLFGWLVQANADVVRGVLIGLAVTGVITFIAGSTVGILISRYITKPVNALAQASLEVADGNLNAALPETVLEDENQRMNLAFRKLIASLKAMINKLLGMVSDLEGLSVQLAEMCSNISHIADFMAKNSDSLQGKADEYKGKTQEAEGQLTGLQVQMQTIVEGARNQAGDATHAAELIRQMESAVADVAVGAQAMADSAAEAEEAAENGGREIEKTLREVQNLTSAVKQTAGSIENLRDRSSRIGEIVRVISDIADQTNLLALNAAIEAARAGEYGRGFAVVAAEVSKLADKSSQATKEIADLIEGVVGATNQSVREMIVGSEQAEALSNSIGIARDSLEAIVKATMTTSEQVQGISAAAEELSASAEEIRGSAERSAQTSEAQASTTESWLTNMKELGDILRMIMGAFNEFKSMSDDISTTAMLIEDNSADLSTQTSVLKSVADGLNSLINSYKR